MAQDGYFTERTFDFLFDLDVHNERAWFEAHRDDFEAHVREPMLRFVADFEAPLHEVSEHFLAEPKKQGGSMFRIHRDVRFSEDKRPYKTWVASQFRHERGKDVHAPGFYLHLEPGNVWAGAGIWHPDRETLTAIRQAIVDDPDAWVRMRDGGWRSDGGWELAGDALKTAPRGFDLDHPLIEDIRRTDFVAMRRLTEDDARAPDFLDRYADVCREVAPFVRYLCGTIGLPF